MNVRFPSGGPNGFRGNCQESPASVEYFYHHWSTDIPWADVHTTEGTHPVVYSAKEGHGSYWDVNNCDFPGFERDRRTLYLSSQYGWPGATSYPGELAVRPDGSPSFPADGDLTDGGGLPEPPPGP